MKYAFYPGCVSRGACPELYASTIEVCGRLGIELDTEVLKGASCTGAACSRRRISVWGIL
jgi:succinate dehydrogenase / fumarate reductase cytochrome b subunit